MQGDTDTPEASPEASPEDELLDAQSEEELLDDEPLLKLDQVAKIMNVSLRLVGELVKTKELRSYRIRGTRRVARRHLDEYLVLAEADDTPTLGERHREAVSRPRRKQSADT